MTKGFNFLFYNACEGAPEGWTETLKVLGPDGANPEDVMVLSRILVSFAGRFRLEGNVWQHWLTYVLMMHENPFTLSCERQTIDPESTVMRLAGADFALFRELFSAEPSKFAKGELSWMLDSFTSYTAPYAVDEPGNAGSRILSLSSRLAAAGDDSEFGSIAALHYETYGAGMYGLYKAFRIADGKPELELVPVTDSADVTFDDLIGYEKQKETLRSNTEAFVSGAHANNVLLYGDSGTGKSTSVHALMHDFFDRGLRLVEVTKAGRRKLSQVISEIKKRNYRFIIYLDDLSFEEDESDYKELKAMLEGALETRNDRVLIYATSNRRHLIRETWRDRNDMEYQEDVHHSDTMEEKLSLASRFGVTIYYPKPAAKEYLGIVSALTEKKGIEIDREQLDDIARKWELRHGGMSGRTASQLITWLESREAIEDK